MSAEDDIPVGRRGLWELSRSSDALAKGIGCDEMNPRRVGVYPSVQPVFSIEDVVPRGVFPGCQSRPSAIATVALFSVCQLRAISEVRVLAATAFKQTAGIVRLIISRSDRITANRVTATKIETGTQPSRCIIEGGTNPTGSFASLSYNLVASQYVEFPIAGIVVPAGSYLSIVNATANDQLDVGFLIEERDGRVILPDSA